MEGKKYGKHLRLYLISTIDNPNITRQPKHHQTTQTSPDNPNIKNHHHRHRHCHHQSSSSPSSSSESHLSKGDNWPPPPWGRKQRCPSDPNRHLPEGDGIKKRRKTIRNSKIKTVKIFRWPSPLSTTRSSYPMRWRMIAAWSSPPLHFLFSSTRWKRDFGVSFIIIIIIFTRFRLSNKLQYDGRRPLDSSLQPLVSLS